MTKKITRKDWEYIGKYNPATKWLRPFCSYTLTELDKGGYRRECRIGWLMYLLIFIPAHILQALYCMWDGGLREFSVEGRYLGYNDINETWGSNKGAYLKAKEVWERA